MATNRFIALFDKVSFERFFGDCVKAGIFTERQEKQARERYDAVRMPVRATAGSAGYDFFLPFGAIRMYPEESRLIPTGIKCFIQPGWCLLLMPRSSYGFEYGMTLANTVGLIDSDYAHAENEGHILIKASSERGMLIEQGDRFVQGIFLPHGLIMDDEADAERDGGLGSTGK